MPSLMHDKFWDLLAKKLSGEASDEELQEMDLLLKDPGLKTLSETISTLWNHEQPVDNTKALEAFESHKLRMGEKGIILGNSHENDLSSMSSEKPVKGFFSKKWLVGISSLVTAIFIIIFGIFKSNQSNFNSPDQPSNPVSQVTTRPGSRTQLHLPDGTSVWLNASSNLTFDENFGKDLREVNLSGEAFFDVVKDPSHPFIIHTKNINIKVLGTEFNVKAYPEDTLTETSLVRGRVEVTIKNRPGEKHFLKPNEKMIVANDQPIEKRSKKIKSTIPLITTESLTFDSTENTVLETSWVYNHLIFHQNETFAEMAPRLERWYGVHFIFENQKAANEYRPFVSFTTETITQALDDLKLAYKFDYKIKGNEITITQ